MQDCEDIGILLRDGSRFLSMTTVAENSGHTYQITLFITTSHHELEAVFVKQDASPFSVSLAARIFCQVDVRKMDEQEFINYLTAVFCARPELQNMKVKQDSYNDK